MSGRSDLGLPEDADVDTVRRRFRALAKTSHPDAGGTAAKFIQVREAYKRALREKPQTNVGATAEADSFTYEDLVEQFEKIRRERDKYTAYYRARWDESTFKPKAYDPESYDKCQTCRGYGWVETMGGPKRCSVCEDGSGFVRKDGKESLEQMASRKRAEAVVKCDACGGKGYRSTPTGEGKSRQSKCAPCNGQGKRFAPGTCIRCQGGGVVHLYDVHGSTATMCPSCNGLGKTV